MGQALCQAVVVVGLTLGLVVGLDVAVVGSTMALAEDLVVEVVVYMLSQLGASAAVEHGEYALLDALCDEIDHIARASEGPKGSHLQ